MGADDGEFVPVAGGEAARCHAVAVEDGIHCPCLVGDIEARDDSASGFVDLDFLTLRIHHAVFCGTVDTMSHATVELVGGEVDEGGLGAARYGEARPVTPLREVVVVEGEAAEFEARLLAEVVLVAIGVDLDFLEGHHITGHAVDAEEQCGKQ